MAKVNVRKETGKLVIDLTYRGVRCREQTALDEGAANRKRVEAVLKKLREATPAAGTLVYGDLFPRSAMAAPFDSLPACQLASHLSAAASKLQTEVAATAVSSDAAFESAWQVATSLLGGNATLLLGAYKLVVGNLSYDYQPSKRMRRTWRLRGRRMRHSTQ